MTISRSDSRTHSSVINININPGDTVDLEALDSLVNAIGEILTKKPESEIYGHQIFKADSIQIFQPTTIAKVPDSYVLGEGDEIAIVIFGTSQLDAKLIIDEAGFISPSQMPKIYLKGLTWGQAKQLVRRRYSNYYIFRPEQFVMSLSEPRTITVNIFGEVERPGSYNLVATNTAFNALVAAGGPTEEGSVRNIRVYNGNEQKVLDIYELMNDMGSQFEYYLEDNVFIQVPAARRIVNIEGAIQRPLKYELLENEGLTELINFAGGLSANAVKEIVQIKRFTNDQQVLLDLNFQELIDRNQNYSLQNGDDITIKSIDAELVNSVMIEGAIELPGEYSIETTPRISDLANKAVLKREARLDVAFLMRANPDSTYKLLQIDLENILTNSGSGEDLPLEPKDKLIIYELGDYVDRSTFSVTGAVRREIEHPFDPEASITIQQAILLAGGLEQEAADIGYIIRTNINNQKEKEYIRVNISDAISSPNGPSNLRLRPLDQLNVLTMSNFTDDSFVTLRGAVRFPQTFFYDPTLSLKDLLTLGGGFKPEASRRIDIFRLNIEKTQPTNTIVTSLEVDDDFNIIDDNADFNLMPYDEIVVRNVPDFEVQSFVTVEGEVFHSGEYALMAKNERLSDIIQRAGGLTPEAFAGGATILRKNHQGDELSMTEEFAVITRLEEVLKNPSSPYNYILKDGDVIKIPKRNDLVFINIANTNAEELFADMYPSGKIGVVFQPGKNAKWYITEHAGGFNRKASKDMVTVQYANGAITGTKGKGIFRKYPKLKKGAVISVGAKPEKAETKTGPTADSATTENIEGQ